MSTPEITLAAEKQPPLPTLHDPSRDVMQELALCSWLPIQQNPWQTIFSQFPVNAETVRPIKPIRSAQRHFWSFQLSGAAVRSSFRKGAMTLSSDGVSLFGIRTQPLRWLQTTATICWLLWFLIGILSTTPYAIIPGVTPYWFLGSVFISIVNAVVTELHRVPAEIKVTWADVDEIQFDRGMRWAILIYRDTPPKPGEVGSLLALPINAFECATIYAFQDAIEVHAPSKLIPNPPAYAWTPTRQITAFAIVVSISIIFATVIYASTH